MEKMISGVFIQDMKTNSDVSQYENQTGTSIEHYLINKNARRPKEAHNAQNLKDIKILELERT